MRLALLTLPLVVAFASLAVDPPTPAPEPKNSELRKARVKELVKGEAAVPFQAAKAAAKTALENAKKALAEVNDRYIPINADYQRLLAEQKKAGVDFSDTQREELLKNQLLLEGPNGLKAKLDKANGDLTAADTKYMDAMKAVLVDAGAEADDGAVNKLQDAIAAITLKEDFDALTIAGLRAENKLDALAAKLDGTVLAAYMQDKLSGLLGSKEFCDAQKECTDNKPRTAPPLKGLFDKKSHGGK